MKSSIVYRYRRAVVLILIGIHLNLALPMRVALAQTPGYDGETIFRGLFFGVGPVADVLPELWQNPDVDQAREQLESAASRVIAQIRREDDTYFGRFQAELQSRDRLRISRALEAASQRVYQIVAPDMPIDAISWPHYEVDVAVSVQAFVIAFVFIYRFVFIFIDTVVAIPAPAEFSPLQRDVLVDQIASLLGI